MFPNSTAKLHRLSRSCKSLSQLKQILAQIIQTHLSDHSPSLDSLLSFSTAKTHHFSFASLLFSQLPNPTPFAYNAMIRSCTNSNLPHQSILLYLRMARSGPPPDNFTYPFVLKACSLAPAVASGKSVHSRILHLGFDADPFVQCSLIRMYSEFDEIDDARKVFDGIPVRDVVLCNSMIGGYVKCGQVDEAKALFEETNDKNVGTYNALLGGYVKNGCTDRALDLFDEMPYRDVVSWNTMIGAQARYGSAEAARKLFDHAPKKNVATWSAFISGLCHRGLFCDAIDVFKKALVDGLRPNQAILVTVLSSCTHLGALELGVWIHGYIDRLGFEVDDWLGSSLIDMYSKCGQLEGAISVFDRLTKRNPCTWTSMIYGFAIHGQSHQALDTFCNMENEGISPNDVTFVAVLLGCSHARLLEEGREIFNRMQCVYGISPKIEHYTCMIDLFARANLLDEARELIKSMPMEPDVFAWGAFLGGLRIYQQRDCLKFDNELREEIERLKEGDSGPFVLVSNIYASCDRWDEVERMRGLMKVFGVKKNRGCSLIEVEGVVHEFLASEKLKNMDSDRVYEMLDSIYRGIKVSFLT